MLTVVTPATNFRLTSVDAVKAELGLADGDTSQDDKIERYISQASAIIARDCRRVFAIETVKETFGCGRGVADLIFERYPVISVSSVSLDGAVLAADAYALNGEMGSLRRLLGGWWGRAAEITYRAGYVLPEDGGTPPAGAQTLPADLERAAAVLAASYSSASGRDPLIKSEDVPGVGSTSYVVPGRDDPFPRPDIRPVLDGYRRPVFA